MYKTETLEKKAVAVIKKHNLVFIEEVVAYLPCDKTTFYAHKLNENNLIKELLEKNKIERKGQLREKMYNAENPTAWVALYKLIGTDDEAGRLSNSNQKIEHSGAIVTNVIRPKIEDAE